MYPQVLINIPLANKIDIESTFIQEIIQRAEEMMGGLGRVLIRESGTQPLLRIMTEGPSKELTEEAAHFLVEKIKPIS